MSIAAGPRERASRAPSVGFPAADALVLGVDIGASSSTGALAAFSGDVVT